MPRAAKLDVLSVSAPTRTCESGFLSQAQQDMLDAAVLDKQKSGVNPSCFFKAYISFR